ncbi:MAG: glycosyltransferase family 4 protein [Candidatus Methanomarinus sp.]|uniref:Glycosyltransferase family 4 protein n=1 Tax=Candidatus Methanomarinus sp. TaxID=3386244 RepID=A0AC61SA67_9EURY|nr:Glycosyltransferase involved in cell wall bisynthesis [ANME-2 cluster archaeon]TKY91455.1 MAG: glycosyltransferase family 4 protein [ANME-2 cluster archaeon]
MLNSNILFVVHSYNSFQKESINSLCKYCNECSVLVRSNPIAEVSKYITIPYLNPFKLDYKIDLTNTPSNVSVYSTPILYAPLDSQYKRLGKKHSNAVEKVIRNNNIKFDLIHSHFTWSSGYAGAKLKEKYNVPFVVTAHGYDIYILPFKDDEWKERIEYVLNSADHIITVSKSNLACIRKLNVNTPVTVLPNGYRDEIFHQRNLKTCRDTLNLPHDKKIILAVGNLVEIKGHKYLIEAMNEVVKHRNDVQCYIVGCGRLENKLKKQIVAAGLQDHVRLVGCKPHDDIPIWMNACDVFVLPSLNEGNPTVMFECLGCGKPFIGTKVGGIPEIIVSDDYGLLSEPTASNELADNILSALDKSWDVDEIKEYAKRFMWKNIAMEILEVYSSVV